MTPLTLARELTAYHRTLSCHLLRRRLGVSHHQAHDLLGALEYENRLEWHEDPDDCAPRYVRVKA